ncbi:MAG: VWA domain-containing protein [Bradymonadales bacterium]|nr:VWA domain-containing protein [Bradymonadales bacterium]
MQFLGITGSLFVTLLAALGGAIGLMYLAKLRRRRVQVPYSPLWAQVLVERQARSLWHRLKRLTSFLLHLLVLLILLVALRDPRPLEEAVDGRHLLILVDTSASMGIRDMPGGLDRMEEARREALQALEALSPRDRVMVVRMDSQVVPLMPFVRPAPWVAEQIGQLQSSASKADLPAALSFVARSLAYRSRPELLVITDGAFPPEAIEAAAAVDLPGNLVRRMVQLGSATGNVAITAFNVRRYLANRLNYEVFVQLSSSFDVPVTVELTLLANDRPVHRSEVELPAWGSAVRTYPNLATGGNRIQAQVRIQSGDAVDLFPLDDTAYALLPHDRRRRVLLVSQDNLFVEAPLLLDQTLEVTRMSPVHYRTSAQAAANPSLDYDVTVLAGSAQPIPDRGGFLFLYPTGVHSPWPARGEITDPIIDRFDRTDPLMRWMQGFRSMNIRRAARLSLTEADLAVARTIEGDAMIVRREEGERRLVGVAFPIEESDFPLRIAYPLFILNALEWLAGGQDRLVESVETDRAARVFTGHRAAGEARLIPPDGEPQLLPIREGYVTIFPDRPGFHELTWEEPEEEAPAAEGERSARSRTLAVNFFDPEESQIAAGDLFRLDAGQAEEPQRAGALPVKEEPRFYLVMAALVLLVLEWITFNRRVTV